MLFAFLVSLFSFATIESAAITPSPHLTKDTEPSPPLPQTPSTAGFDIPLGLDGTPIPMNIDPRFTYDKDFGNQILDGKSAYVNTLLALADLSTKGWTPTLGWDAQYTSSSYGDVTIRIHASLNPSTLQYRYAIWGLYRAIRETAANGFRECLLTLYWSIRVGWTGHVIGYVSILGGSSLGIGGGNSTQKSLPRALPRRVSPPGVAPSNFTATLTDFSSVMPGSVRVDLLGKSLDIDAVFDVIYAAILHLSPQRQIKSINEPGVIKDPVSRTVLRWDSTHLTVYPTFEYRHAITALAVLGVCMYRENRFEEARFTVFVNEIEVGRGWLYRTSVGA